VVLVNGIATEALGVRDRGLHYGDGLFETLAVSQGRPLCWDPHMARLLAGCERLRLPCPDADGLRKEAREACAALPLGVLKILITRGAGGRGYRPPREPVPTRIVMTRPWPPYPPGNTETGVTVIICQTRLGTNPGLAGLKHLNRLEQVLARSEWDDPGIAEGLMLDATGRVVEGTMTNLFMLSRGRLLTPALDEAGVAGVMRRLILETAPDLGLPATECSLNLRDLNAADELFLSNSLVGVWPVRELAGRAFKVGPVARRLRQELGSRGYLATTAAMDKRSSG